MCHTLSRAQVLMSDENTTNLYVYNVCCWFKCITVNAESMLAGNPQLCKH